MKFAFVPAIVVLGVSAGCITEMPGAQSHHDHSLSDQGRLHALSPGEQSRRWLDVAPFRQVGLLVDTPSDVIEARVDGGDWGPVEITWHEGEHKVGRLVLEHPARQLELRTDRPWSFGTVQFFDQVEASEVLARDLPVVQAEPSVAAFGPASLVVSRAQWGARNPNRVCGSWHNPNRISIHHTDIPADDGGEPAARLRQMQAYHIDTRGWCDIGYHFVVSQSGKVYQGRNEERTGAHVDNYNSGNVGISFIGNFDRQSMGPAQFAAGARILGWVARTYDVPFSRRSIVGHRENPGQATDCPGSNLLGRIDQLIEVAQTGGAVEPARPPAVSFEVNWRSEEADFYSVGGSRGIVDVFSGDWMRAEIKLENTTTMPLRGVRIGYDMEHLVPVDYVIESDAPHFDGVHFERNDADANPNNPPPNRLGSRGTLGIYAMAPGETKRIIVDFNAGDYSIGAVEHARLRAWVRHIDSHYGEQTTYDTDPATNVFDELLQAAVAADVLSVREWQFDAGEANQLEGWSGCSGVNATVDPNDGTLQVRTGPMQCVESPAWTSIDANDWDQVVLRLEVDAAHEAALYWAHDGEVFTGERAVRFGVRPEQRTYVVDLSSEPSWRGEITRLRVVPSIEDSVSTAIDAVYLQSSNGTVASVRERHVAGRGVRVASGAPTPLDGGVIDGRGDSLGVGPGTGPDSVRAAGCNTSTGHPSLAALLLALLFGPTRRTRS